MCENKIIFYEMYNKVSTNSMFRLSDQIEEEVPILTSVSCFVRPKVLKSYVCAAGNPLIQVRLQLRWAGVEAQVQ